MKNAPKGGVLVFMLSSVPDFFEADTRNDKNDMYEDDACDDQRVTSKLMLDHGEEECAGSDEDRSEQSTQFMADRPEEQCDDGTNDRTRIDAARYVDPYAGKHVLCHAEAGCEDDTRSDTPLQGSEDLGIGIDTLDGHMAHGSSCKRAKSPKT